MSTVPPPSSSTRLEKLRKVVAARGDQPNEPAGLKAPPKAEPPHPETQIEVPARAVLSERRKGVRTAMIWSIVAWTVIMPAWLIFVAFIRQGEGRLPSLSIDALLHSQQGLNLIFETATIWVLGLLYMLPGIVAAARRHPFFAWILLINIFGGVLVVPWVVALAAALWNPGPEAHAAFARWLAPKEADRPRARRA
jgi:hypothetical protein